MESSSDGSLNFDTSINTDGFDSGANELKKMADQICSSIEKMGKEIKDAVGNINTTSAVQSVENVDKSAKKTTQSVKRTKKALDDFDNVTSIQSIQQQIDSDSAALNKLVETQKQWDSMGFDKNAAGYKELQQKIDDTRKSIEYAKGELESENEAIAANKEAIKAAAEAEKQAAKTDVEVLAQKKFEQQQINQQVKERVAQMQQESTQTSFLGRAWNKVQGIVKGFGSTVTKGTGGFKKLASAGKSALNVIKKHTIGSNSAMGGFGNTITKSLKRIKSMAKTILFFRLFRSALTTLKNQMGSMLKANTDFTSSLSKVKGNLLTAFQPIYETIMPMINMLMTGLTILTSKLAQFTSALFGKTVKSSQAAADALNKQATATTNASKATEKASTDIDEFHVLNDNSDSGSSGSTTAPTFDVDESDTGVSDFAEKLKEAWSKADFTEIGKIIGDKINASLESINWAKIRGTSKKIAKSIATFLNGGIGETDWSLVGASIANGINTGLDFVYTFVTTFDWKNLGNAIASSITSFFRTTDWAELGMDASGLIIGLLTTIIAAIQNTDWTDVGKSIGTMIANIDWTTIFTDVALIISESLGALKDILKGALEGMGLNEDTADFIATFTLILGGLILAFGALPGVIGLVGGAIMLLTNPVTLIIVGIGLLIAIIYELIKNWDSVVETMKKVDEFITNIFTHDWTKEFGVLGNILNGFFHSCNDVYSGVKNIFGGLIDFIKHVFTGNWSAAWKDVVRIFGGIMQMLHGVAKAPINLVIGLINGLIQAAEAAANFIVGALNTLSFDVPSWVPFIGGEKFGFNLPKVSLDKIPYLATGAVIPANNPFVAMLGDQKHGTNIETPEKLLRQIMQEELGKSNSTRQDVNVSVELLGEFATLFKAMVREYKIEKDKSGKDPILGI